MGIRYTKECREAAEGRYPVGPDGKRPVSIKVQENWWLENVFGRAHPITPIFWFGPPAVYGVWVGAAHHGLLRAFGCFFIGWLVWSLLEYVLHRYVFHFNPEGEQERLTAFLLHGYHHAFPNDRTRLVAPPWMSWPPGLAILGVYLLLVSPPVAFNLFAGTALGYVSYDWVHYYTHHFKPGNPLGKWLRQYHLQHHHAHEHSRFGVSSPLWDYVFNTYKPPVRAGQKA
jgi:sterol desaturase/sphingolipid hydroxylase (fatty acid hydroxylase superfamily)